MKKENARANGFSLIFAISGVVFAVAPLFTPVLADENDEGYEVHEVDEDGEENLIEGLASHSQLYGHPSNQSGEYVSKWSPDSNVYPEELGVYVEGDILHPLPNAKNGLRSKSSRWPKKTIPYEISPYIRGHDRQIIYSAIEDYHKHTCLKFKERTAADDDYIVFTNSNTGCWSSVGRIGGRQEVNLQSPGCTTKKGTVMHEILHAVGFMHEQNRPDRDDYVIINYRNIEPGRESNFEKMKTDLINNLGIEYDYGSVMHYSGNAFSKNGYPTIEPKGRRRKLGQRDGFSRRDLKKISKMYECESEGSGASENKPTLASQGSDIVNEIVAIFTK